MQARIRFLTLLLATALPTGVLAQAAPTGLDGRIGKLEKEMRAVQRTVFPLGVPVEPETGAPTPPIASAPAGSPIVDLNARVDNLEKALAALTAQVEQTGFAQRQLDTRLKALEAQSAAAAAPNTTAASATPQATPSQPDTTVSGATVVPSAAIRPSAAASAPAASTQARQAALAAVELPMTGDTAEDLYTYGFRLYSAKLFPEAQAKLKEFLAAYPRHRRASFAQNLLGRAYLDEGKPALASVAFYENYQKMPRGERAPESLYWLGQALVQLGKTAEACKAYGEFGDVYGATATAELKARVAKGRADAKCAA